MIDIQKLSTGQKIDGGPIWGIITVEAVYFQGDEWKADIRFDDGSLYHGETNRGMKGWMLA